MRSTCYCVRGGWENCVIYDDNAVGRIVGDLSSILREAAWGRANWDDACRRLAEALPGSVPIVANHDLSRGVLNSAFMHGMEPGFIDSYRDHYVSVNPWLEFWATAPSGRVSLSERTSPSAAFRHTEFYNDWLIPHGNMTAAAGMRVDVDLHNSIQLVWHYDAAIAPVYDAPAAAILERLKGDVVGAVSGVAALRDGLESVPRLGALIESVDGAALLVTRERRIREANAQASAALREAKVLGSAGDMLLMRDPAAQRWLEETVARLVDGQPVTRTTMTFGLDDRVFSITATRAPDYAGTSLALLVRSCPRVLVVVRLLAGGPIGVDFAALRAVYGLSTAEIRLCEILLNGHSLAEAAEMLGVSEGTVRQRVKVIFLKTRTHRQGELIALLARFGSGGWPTMPPG